MQSIIFTWNYITVISLCAIFLSALILCCRTAKSSACTTVKLMPTVMFFIVMLRCFFDLKTHQKTLKLHLPICKLYDREKFVTFQEAYLKLAYFFKPETVQVLLNSAHALDKGKEYRFLKPWLGNGLLLSSKNKWRNRRKLLTPAFHFAILKSFIPCFNYHSSILVQRLLPLAERDWIDLVPAIKLCTLDIICESAMGIRMNIQLGNFAEYVTAVKELGNCFVLRIYNPVLWNDTIFYCLPQGRRNKQNVKLVHDFTRKIIKEKKELLLKNQGSSSSESPTSNKRKAFLELLLEQHFSDETFTEEDIREEVDTFMFEGHDTTAAAISWALYCLGLYPEIQENVCSELKRIFTDDPERSISSEDLTSMNYLECVIKETLRLYPPVPLVGRQLKESIQVLNNIVTPDFTCILNIYVLHRNEEYFPNPEKFDPDRFLPQNIKQLHPLAYIPFSAGQRNCIGQKFALIEMKIVLAHVLRHFEVTSLDQRDKLNLTFGFILRNADPLRIKLIPRSST